MMSSSFASTVITLLVLALSRSYPAFQVTTTTKAVSRRKSLTSEQQQRQLTSCLNPFRSLTVPRPSRPSLQLNLFFQQQESNTRSPWKGDWYIPTELLESLSNSESFSLPVEFDLEYQGGDTTQQQQPPTLTSTSPPSIRIRKLRRSDLDQIVPLCVQEFGDFAINETVKFASWKNLQNEKEIEKWIESIMFEPMIRFALELKIRYMEKSDFGDTVICLEERGKGVVAMAELSLQPLDAERNPPPIPLPLWIKQLLAQGRGVDGWVTNVLVAPEARGRGYSKALMKVIEGIAKQWPGCNSISLHVDADPNGGRIPQALYLGLGYRPVILSVTQNRYKWMGPEQIERGLVVVEQVPLLFLRKYLSDSS